MKKFSVIALVCALAMMVSVPFGAFADAPIAVKGTATVGEDNAVEVVFDYALADNAEYGLANGEFTITFPADKLTLNANSGKEENAMCKLPGKVVNAEKKAEGEVIIGFMTSDAYEIMDPAALATLPFTVKEGVTGPIEVVLTFKVLTAYVDDVNAEDLLADGALTATATIEIEGEEEPVATTTEAEATTTTTTTTAAPAATTTKAPSTTGEATPWALLATVTVAGAALVVLSTKKSK